MSNEVLIVDVEKGLPEGTVKEQSIEKKEKQKLSSVLIKDGVLGDDAITNEGPLTPEQVAERRATYGMNSLASEKKNAWYTFLLQSLLHPFNVLLILIALVSAVEFLNEEPDYATTIIISVMVLISTALRFVQEWKSEGAVHGLLKLITKSVCVIRFDPLEGAAREMSVPAEELVPGDIVVLRPGELVPADARIVSSKVFYVSQAPLTGEALPVEKYKIEVDPTQDPKVAEETQRRHDERVKRVSLHKQIPKCRKFLRTIFGLKINTESQLDQAGFDLKEDLSSSDIVFMGTEVITGMAVVVLIRTGSSTLFGRMAEALSNTRSQNPFQEGVRRVSWTFFLTMAFMVPIICIIQGWMKKDWKNALIFSLAVAVGLTPEMLPMIVNANLAKGSVELTKKSSIVKKLDAIINLGAVDVLCTDKTGTLTKSVVHLRFHLDPYGQDCYFPLLMGYLNSYFQSVLKNPLDVAITTYYDKITSPSDPEQSESEKETDAGSQGDTAIVKMKGETNLLDPKSFVERYSRIDEIPFDFVRRRLSVILKENSDKSEAIYLVCKGAVEEILSVCTKVIVENIKKGDNVFPSSSEIVELKEDKRERFLSEYQEHTERGQRVLGVAFKTMPNTTKTASAEDETELVFLGFLAFTDPPKETAAPAIKELIRHNIEIKVLTGDAPNICAAVCAELGLPVKGIVTGDELSKAEKTGEIALEDTIRKGTIFAKLTPLQKLFVVKKLKDQNHVVGFMGDGINDAPALKEADVGISVENGLDICRESSDVILLDKDLSVVVNGIRIGRKTYGNTIKYIAMAVSSNFGNVFSVLVASIWLPYEPMTSLHLLIQNLLYDISQVAIPWDSVDEEFIIVPHKWRIKSILRFMIWMGPWSSVFDISTFVFMYYYFNIQQPEVRDPKGVQLFQTAWFTVGLLTQTLIVHMIRTEKIPVIQSRASFSLTVMTMIVMGIGLALPYVPKVGDYLKFSKVIPMEFYYFLVGVLAAYCLVANIAKCIYIAIFREWF